MMTLITGQPGQGKTLYALVKVKEQSEKENRPVWYHGINGLTLPWTALPTADHQITGRNVSVPEWWKAPAGSIVVIDEAQDCGFGVRPRGVVPDWAQRLEKHRHLGIDLYLITQGPKLIDSHDRDLCELHFHLTRKFGSKNVTIQEFRPVQTNVLTNKKGGIPHHWRYPKEAFTWYKSAEEHTHKVRIPARFWVFVSLPFVIVGLIWFAWNRYLDPNRAKGKDILPGQASAAASPAGQVSQAKLTAAQYIEQYQPRIPGLTHSAPVYDEITKPVRAPTPAACVASRTRCQCYSEQATRLEVPDDLCRNIVAGGFYVNWANEGNKGTEERATRGGNIREEPTPPAPPAFGFDAGDIRGAPIADIRSSSAATIDDGPPTPGRGKNLPPAR